MPKCSRSQKSPSVRTNRCLPWRRLDSKRRLFNRRSSSRAETPFNTYALRTSTFAMRWCNDVALRYRLKVSTSGSSGMANVTLAIVPANAQCARRHDAADRIVCVTSFAELGAMSSERLLLGQSKTVRLKSNDFFSEINPRRTSKSKKCPDGFSEPTATIVWGTLSRHGLKPDQFVLWNAFPWHSFDPRHGMLSNRMPDKSERAAGLPVLRAFLELFPCDQVVALGKVAAAGLDQLGIAAHCVRHPASGGARL